MSTGHPTSIPSTPAGSNSSASARSNPNARQGQRRSRVRGGEGVSTSQLPRLDRDRRYLPSLVIRDVARRDSERGIRETRMLHYNSELTAIKAENAGISRPKAARNSQYSLETYRSKGFLPYRPSGIESADDQAFYVRFQALQVYLSYNLICHDPLTAWCIIRNSPNKSSTNSMAKGFLIRAKMLLASVHVKKPNTSIWYMVPQSRIGLI